MSYANCCGYTFDSVKHIGKATPIGVLERNLKSFYDYAFLNIGAWDDIVIGTTSPGGRDYSELVEVCIPSCLERTLWQGFRKDWVWETGVEYLDDSGGSHYPLDVEVQVDSVPLTSGYEIDYENGRVKLDSAISATSTIQAQYSYRLIQTYIGDDVPWWRELQFRSYDIDDGCFKKDGGDWVVAGEYRIQMPALVISAASTGVQSAYGLGKCKLRREQLVKFHIISEDKCLRDRLVDIILLQDGKCLWLYDPDVLECDRIPYPDLAEANYWGNARSDGTRLALLRTLSSGLYEAVLVANFSILFDRQL